MSKEFTYHQRPPDNRKEFERNYENIFSNRKDVYNDKLKVVSERLTRELEILKTTEQKQPSLKD